MSWSVVARAAEGEHEARSRFGQCYLPVVRSFLIARWRATPLEVDVDDAVQEVFVACLREGGALTRAEPERGDLRGFLFGITTRVAARFEQHAVRRQDLGGLAGSGVDRIADRESNLSVVFDREWARTLVRLAGERMRAEAVGHEALRRVELLELRFAEGLPTRAIAERWGEPPKVIQRAYERARAEFRASLRAVVAEHATRQEAELDADVERVIALLRRDRR